MNLKLILQSAFLVTMALVILLIAGILPLPSFLAGSENDTAKQQQSIAQPVTVIQARTQEFIQTVRLTGSLVAREEILVAPELSGLRITAINASEGDAVVKGQILAELVDTQLKTLIAQNDAALAKADAAIAQAKSLIMQAQASNDEAAKSFERAKVLKRKGHISVATLDIRNAAARTANARLVSARDGLKLANADRLQVAAQRRELDWKMSNTRITAPGDGIISRKNAKLGALASGADVPLFHIIAKGEIEMEADVAETDLPDLRPGQLAQIGVPGMSQLSGTVRLIYPEVNKSSRLGRVRIFIGKNRSLHIGNFARATVETSTGKGIAVPQSAVLFGDNGANVQIVSNTKIVTRAVTTGLRAKGQIEITTGIVEGDLVVVRAGTFLRAGDSVKPVVAPAGKLREARR